MHDNTKMKKKRNYKREYEMYHSLPEQRKNRSLRNQARDMMKKAGKVRKGDGKEVDHFKSLYDGGSNRLSNLRVLSRRANRVKGRKSHH